MSDLRTAAQQALEALEKHQEALKAWPEHTLAPHECVAMDASEKAITALRSALAQQAEPVQEPYTGDVTRIMRDAGMTFHLGPPHKAVVEQMTRGVDLVYAEASIKTAQQFSAALAQQAKPVWMHPWPPVRAQQAEPVSADPHTTTLRNLLKFCLPWEPDACVLGNVTARQAVTALRAALAQQDAPNAHGYASRLAFAIWNKHYKDIAPQWKPLDDLMGVLTQIDNMTSGLTLLAQQAEPVEPVAWMYDCGGGGRMYAEVLDGVPGWTPLYTAPPQRKPLTEEEIGRIGMKHVTLREVIRAVERAHGIGEQP